MFKVNRSWFAVKPDALPIPKLEGKDVGCSADLKNKVATARTMNGPCWNGKMIMVILAAYASNYIVGRFYLRSLEWRYELGAAALPAFLFLGTLFLIPDSPRWLSRYKSEEDELLALRHPNVHPHSGEISLVSTFASSSNQRRLFSRQHLKVILIGLSIGVLNQLSGINAILYYLNDIFAQAGFSATSAQAQAVVIGCANLLFTILAMLLIDSMGRRFLLIVGSTGMAFCLVAIASIFATAAHKGALLWLLILYIAFFAVSQGTVVWVYLSENFPSGIREKGQSLRTLALWLTNGVVAPFYPKVASIAGQYPFFFFAAKMLIQLVITWFIYPETKGLSLEEAADDFSVQASLGG